MVERAEPGGADGAELWRRTLRRLTWAAVAANGLGGIVMFLLLGFLVPFAPAGADRHLALNGIVAAIYLPLALALGTVWARRRAAPIQRWLEANRPPTEAERRMVLGEPFDFVFISGVFWVIGAVLFTALNMPTVGLVGTRGRRRDAARRRDHLRGRLPARRADHPADHGARPGRARRLRSASAPALPAGWRWHGRSAPASRCSASSRSPPRGSSTPNEDPALLAAAVAFLAGIGLAVGSFAISIASRSVSEPIAAVRRAIARVEEGDFDAEVPVDDGSEVGLLEAGFNSMAAGLRERERLRDLFGRHVGREVAEAALERDGEVELGGELREVAIVFVDVIGSTRLTLRRRPHEVVALLNRFFALVVEVVEQQCGWVNKFEGDAALCVFGAPTAQPGRRRRRAARGAHPEPSA